MDFSSPLWNHIMQCLVMCDEFEEFIRVRMVPWEVFERFKECMDLLFFGFQFFFGGKGVLCVIREDFYVSCN